MSKDNYIDRMHERIVDLLARRRFRNKDREFLFQRIAELQKRLLADDAPPVAPIWERLSPRAGDAAKVPNQI